MAETDNLEELERLPVDSGMDAATVEKAEWLWTHFPILTRWHTQPTYVKALVCRAIRKIEADATAREVEGLREAHEDLGEALFHLSDKLRGSGFLSDDANHAAYEAVVAAFAALEGKGG